MRYFFSDECYYDSDERKGYRNGESVRLSDPQIAILDFLCKNNGKLVSHEDLYRECTGLTVMIDDTIKTYLSSQFTAKGGICKKMPEVNRWRKVTKTRTEGDGAYGLNLPADNIKATENSPVDAPSVSSSFYSALYQQLLEKADSGDVEAAYEFAAMCFYGLFEEAGRSKRDYTLACQYFLKVIEKDQSTLRASSLNMIGHMYYNGHFPNGDGTYTQSYEKAYEYIEKAAEEILSAKQHIAYMQSVGSGCEYNYQAVKEYYLSFVDKADVMAKIHFANILKDHGDFALAAKYFSMAINEGNDLPEAAYQLGMIYKNGTHTLPATPDYFKAKKCFEICMESKRYRARASYEIGMLYFIPTGTFQKNFKKAERYFAIAAMENHTLSHYMLGYMYENGHIRIDFLEAIRHYEAAAERGSVISATNLAYLYQQLQIPQYKEAFRWAKWAADQGDAYACFTCANLLLLGRGCQKDLHTALKYYFTAEEHGFFEASLMRKRVQELLKKPLDEKNGYSI